MVSLSIEFFSIVFPFSYKAYWNDGLEGGHSFLWSYVESPCIHRASTATPKPPQHHSPHNPHNPHKSMRLREAS
jgi:hypothetical protein